MKKCEYCGEASGLSPCVPCQSFLRRGTMVRWPYSNHTGLGRYLDAMTDSEWLAKNDRLQDLIVRERVPWDSVFRKE